MKRTILTITTLALCLLAFVPEAGAQQRATRDIEVKLMINKDGCVRVFEKRDVTETQGTEQYIVRSTEGDLDIKNLTVFDSAADKYLENIGEWDVNASFEQKAGKCGLVHKSNSVEICYGLGSYGDHLFSIDYEIENCVKSLNDYDMLFLTVVNDGIDPLPQHVSARIWVPGVQLDTLNTRIWAFGYEGDINFNDDGQVIAESSAPFKSNSKMIVLMRFEKGILQPTSVIDKDFKHYQDMAFEGSDYGEPKDTKAWPGIVGFLAILAGIIGLGKSSVAKKKRNMLGMKPDEVMWFRDVPANGDLIEANYIISQLGEQKGKKQKGSLAAAYILQMVIDGQLISRTNEKGKSEFKFADWKLNYSMPQRATELYQFMKEAAGSDNVLQDREFKVWAMKNADKMEAWMTNIVTDGVKRLATDGSLADKLGRKFSPDGQQKCREVLGMKKFLTDFTIVDQRDVPEAQLWKEYLVYGALYGVADKVCKDLQQIDPSLYETIVEGGSTSLINACNLSNSFSGSMLNAVASANAARSGGSGGHSSFGGGGGSFGGGHGGGTR